MTDISENQADAVGIASGTITFLNAAFRIIQETRKARDRVRGASQRLDDVSEQLSPIERSLKLVEEEENLHTASVETQVKTVTVVTEELKAFLDHLSELQQRKPTTRLLHALRAGDKEDEELKDILSRLDRSNNELGKRIQLAQVGLVGNLQDGFKVAYGVLVKTDKKVNEILGVGLALMSLIKKRRLPQMGTCNILSGNMYADTFLLGGSVSIDISDLEDLENNLGGASTSKDEREFVDNITLDQARVMMGDVGLEDWQKAAGRKTTVARNQFGHSARIMMGNVGGEGAAAFNQNFWN